MTLKISNHAVDRYCERIGLGLMSPADALAEIQARLETVKPKHIEKARRKNTQYLRTDGCVLIACRGKVVTVVKQMREAS